MLFKWFHDALSLLKKIIYLMAFLEWHKCRIRHVALQLVAFW
jgi:hypothetical protein